MNSVSLDKVFLIAGMHRSGTSALCAAMHACGVHFGEDLLDAIEGVNDEGFWEDSEVVAVNDDLLNTLGLSWYSLPSGFQPPDWSKSEFDEHRQAARTIVERGFGGTPVGIKDPRFCLTLPFWLDVLSGLGFTAQVVSISRSPSEIASSLNKRDGLPRSYGLRLVASHLCVLERSLPANTVRLTFDSLLADTEAVLSELGLSTAESGQDPGVRADLRHHHKGTGADRIDQAVLSLAEAEHLIETLDREYPLPSALNDLTKAFADRGLELSEIGDAHTAALATLDQRDVDIDALSAEHKQALAVIVERDQQITELDQRLEQAGAELEVAMTTITERDEQIAEFDRRLTKLGDEHTHALEVLRERDAQLERLRTAPGIGLAVRWILSNEKS